MNTILHGDALEVLRTLPSACVQMVCTSPPYYCLRSYLPNEHQDKHLEIGLEETPQEYVARLVKVFREVHRVLRPDGSLWINIGDTYANDQKYGGHSSGKHQLALHQVERPRRYTGLPAKNLLGIPWRLALALQDDGWILRQDIIWSKVNPLPESVQDRPSRSHEYVFLFTKRPKYFYDADAIRTPLKAKTLTTFGCRHQALGNDDLGKVKSDNWGKSIEEHQPRLNGDGEMAGANAKSVWEIASEPFPCAHFAVMPSELARRCILAGSSPLACEHCRTPWQRRSIPTGHVNRREAAHVPGNSSTKTDSTGWAPTRLTTLTWEPTCACSNSTGSGKCIILDPFLGAGTVALVALQQKRDFIGIELNADYIEMAKKRIEVVQPVLWD